MGFDHVDVEALKKVHDILKHNIGAMRILFNATGIKPMTPFIKDIAQDIVDQYHFNEDEKAATMYLVSLARVKGTETAEYHNFVNVLKRPVPKVPASDEPFLPYLSFLCSPNKCYKTNKYEPIDGVKNYDSHKMDSIIPSHPQYVTKPMPTHRDSYRELILVLQNMKMLTYHQFTSAIMEIDSGLTRVDIRNIYLHGADIAGEQKVSETTTVPAELLIEIVKPHLTMLRQKRHDSANVRNALSWIDNGYNSEPSSLRNGTSSARTTHGGVAATSLVVPASPRYLGGKQTKSAELRVTLSKALENDSNSPRFKGEYRHIPIVPKSHYNKNSKNMYQSIYSPRRQPKIPAAPANPNAAEAVGEKNQNAEECY